MRTSSRLNDGSHSYAYDAESRIVSVDGGAITYAYDANGQRVRKTVGGASTDYAYDLAGHAIAEVNASGWQRGEVYAGGRHLATYANSTTYFDHGDWLGTERVRTAVNGSVCESITSLPFGDGESTTGSCADASTRHFTGKERDPESNLDYFGARYNSSSLGRFMSPDWASDPTAVPYAFYTNPQSLNLYNYMRNNPLSGIDPDGHCCDIWDVIDFVGGAINAYSSDTLGGAFRTSAGDSAHQSGQALGDSVATIQGGLEMVGGVAGEGGGLALDSTGVGALLGVPANVASAGLIVHGAATAGVGAHNLVTDAMQSSGFSDKAKADARASAGGKCEYCGQETTPGQKSQKGVTPPGNEGQTDHYNPSSKGGSNDPSNAVHACRTCNQEKSNTPPQGTKFEKKKPDQQ